LHDALTEERKALTQDLDQISLKAMDRLAWGLGIVVAAAVLVLLLGALAGLFVVRRIFFRNVTVSPASVECRLSR
jgi:hypothetical protein